jgi:hypothetical protein
MTAREDRRDTGDGDLDALRRWLNGQDAALEEWLDGRVRPIRRRRRALASL